MTYIRLYAGPDGESHFEDVEIDLPEETPWGSVLSTMMPAKGIIFRRSPVGHFIDWHVAKSRRFVITVSGVGEKTASDGEVRRLGPGSILLAEDTTGKGHITRVVGNEERVSIFVLLDD